MKTAVVIPNHLKNLDFLTEWTQLVRPDVTVMIIQDNEWRGECPVEKMTMVQYTHEDIEKELGDKAWIIPRKTSAIKSFGFYMAWKQGFDTVIALDNDCFPQGWDVVVAHNSNLTRLVTLDWFKSCDSTPLYTRGFPYMIRNKAPVLLSHGLWSSVPDLDAPTQLQYPDVRFPIAKNELEVVPRHNYFPMCGMNLAFKQYITPLMYFGLQGPEYPYDRFDDIWAGVIVKKIIDHLQFAAVTGAPSIEHRKQSNVFTNLKKEAPGMEVNEEFWKVVDRMELKGSDPVDLYKQVAYQLTMEGEYWSKLQKAMLIWADLFQS